MSLNTNSLSTTLLEEQVNKVALKVQVPPCPWEFYISRTIHDRLEEFRHSVNVQQSLMYANAMHAFPDGSCLVTKHHKNLTLLHAVNEYNKTQSVMPESLLLLYSIEILHIVEQLHSCQIIHGDVKPDNFLLLPDDDEDEISHFEDVCATTKHVKLIDFGRSIDMRLFPAGTTFNVQCHTQGFTCPEMQTGRPWTYQTDMFGIAATVHCLMFGSYMKVYQESGHWKHTSSIKRSYMANWKMFYDTLLNIESCDALPSLGELRAHLEENLEATQDNLVAKKKKLQTLLFN